MKGEHPVDLLCAMLTVSRSGYYKWKHPGPSRRAQDDAVLSAKVAEAHRRSRRTYGAPRVMRELRAQGVRTSKRRCARLLKTLGLHGRRRSRGHPRTTDSRHGQAPAPNRLAHQAPASGPNQVWVTDITYLETSEGWLYLAAILDLWSRRIVGWACAPTLHAALVLCALQRALQHRRPSRGLLHHSDRGVQYVCAAYVAALAAAGIERSMSRAGNCYDNATMESFWSTLKLDTQIDLHRPDTRRAAELVIFDYIETFYNPTRRHSSLDYLSPVAFEKLHQQNTNKAA
jgi:transposase InsO family protein